MGIPAKAVTPHAGVRSYFYLGFRMNIQRGILVLTCEGGQKVTQRNLESMVYSHRMLC